MMFVACGEKKTEQQEPTSEKTDQNFEYISERFDDIQMLRYRIPGFEELSLDQKKLAYYLYEAGLNGRDIFFDQKNRYNLYIRKTLENIIKTYSGDRNSEQFNSFLTYAKKFFFANGMHHHYSNNKMLPEFSNEYFAELVSASDASGFPSHPDFDNSDIAASMQQVMWDPEFDPKAVDFSPGIDVVQASSINFFGQNVTQERVDAFYASKYLDGLREQPSWGLNSKVVLNEGDLTEKVWMSGGMYGEAIDKMIYWLEKAAGVAENEVQKQTLELLVEYYRTGDLAKFDEYSISWVGDTMSTIDVVNGFIEVYHDPLHRKGSYESIVSMKDFEASKRIAAISDQAQWFEDNSPLMEEHKKKSVKGISAKVITIIGEVGGAAPSTPIGINLPNAEWIREDHGSKSVSLGNIVDAYNYKRAKSPMIDEFGYGEEVRERYKKNFALASNLHTDMHEVIGHASGQINPGVGTSGETLKNYASTLEEGRADLVALYFATDPKLVEIGVMPGIEVGMAEYDYYIINGLMTQLYRVKEGEDIEEAHMRNRQMVAKWAYENGKNDNVIEKIVENGKTYFRINDYEKLRVLFGDLLREIQRIKSEGDYEAGKALVENYGVKVDEDLRKEVHERYEQIDIAPYSGFIQPRLVPVMEGEEITDIRVEYPDDFLGQMIEYGDNYGNLGVDN
jgi:dipeptidyl-peptidase-3